MDSSGNTTFAGDVTIGASKKLYMNNTTTDLMMDTNQIGIDAAGKNFYIHGFNGSNGNISLGKASAGTITVENLLSVGDDATFAGDLTLNAGTVNVNRTGTGVVDFLKLENTNTGDGTVDIILEGNRDSNTHISRIRHSDIGSDDGSQLDFYTTDGDANLDLALSINASQQATFSGAVIIGGNLTVSGSTTTVNTEEILLADNTIVLNSNLGGSTAPSENAGIEIERGNANNVSWLWDETNDRWTAGTNTIYAGGATFTGGLIGTTGTFSSTLGVTGHITATTGTFSGNLDTADTGKLRLGNGSDLQIYHDGSHSYIKDAGTGNLYINTNSFRVTNAGANEQVISAYENGAVELYYDDSKKIETTSAGVTISGTIGSGAITSTAGVSATTGTFSGNIHLLSSTAMLNSEIGINLKSSSNPVIQIHKTGSVGDNETIGRLAFYSGNTPNKVAAIQVKSEGTSQNSAHIIFDTMNAGSNATALTLAHDGSATFAGKVQLTATHATNQGTALHLKSTGGHNWYLHPNGTTGNLELNYNDTVETIFDANGNVTFAGEVAVDKDMTVAGTAWNDMFRIGDGSSGKQSVNFTSGTTSFGITVGNTNKGLIGAYHDGSIVYWGADYVLNQFAGNVLLTEASSTSQGRILTFEMTADNQADASVTGQIDFTGKERDGEAVRTWATIKGMGADTGGPQHGKLNFEVYDGGTVKTPLSLTEGNATFAGNVLPSSNNSKDLGSSTYRWANVYTADLHLKNETGDWTVEEGEEELFLHNNLTGKKYAIMMREVE